MNIIRLITIGSLLLFLGVAGAEYQFHNVSEFSARVQGTSVAISYDGTIVVAFGIEGLGVYTRTIHEDMIEPLIFHGPGMMPSVCWSSWGFTLAYADGPNLLTRRGDGLDWYDMSPLATPSGENVLWPRLTGRLGEPDHPHTYLVWEEDGENVWLSGRWGDTWSTPEAVADPASDWGSTPQALRLLNGDTRIYQMNEMNTCINFHQGDFGSGSYSTEQIFPGLGYFGSQFDVGMGQFGTQGVLSMGPQPTCPCNVVWYTEQSLPGDWTDPLDLTIYRDEYNFPQFPCIEWGPDQTVHAYWFQDFSDYMMEESGRDLFYFIRGADGVWVDHSDILGGHVGIWCSMDMGAEGKPAFVFAPGDYPDRSVWLARDVPLSGTPDTPVALRLSAWPNPFNPKTTLRFTMPEAGRAELAIYDLSGRRVATLLDEPCETGEVVVEWTASGLASGLYLAQVTLAGSSEVKKLVLLK